MHSRIMLRGTHGPLTPRGMTEIAASREVRVRAQRLRQTYCMIEQKDSRSGVKSGGCTSVGDLGDAPGIARPWLPQPVPEIVLPEVHRVTDMPNLDRLEPVPPGNVESLPELIDRLVR